MPAAPRDRAASPGRAQAAAFAAFLALSCGCVFAAPGKPPTQRVGDAPFNGAIVVDGPTVWIDAKMPGRLVRLKFHGKAGQRLGLGLSGIELEPESASTLVIDVRGPDGELLPASPTIRCYAETDLHPIDGCDGEFTLASTGNHTIEIDTPFTATARFKASLSTPATGVVATDRDGSVTVKRTGQDARFRLAVGAGSDLTLSARDATPGRGGGAFMLRVFAADGTLVSETHATAELGATLPLHGASAGDFWIEVDPEHARRGVFEVRARSAVTLALDGPPVPFATRAPNEVLRFAFAAAPGEAVTLAVDGLEHHPDVDSNSRYQLKSSDGAQFAFASCFTHAMYGLAVQPCSVVVPALPAGGRYILEISPPMRATVSGRLLLTRVVSRALAPGAPVPVGPMLPGQVARYAFTVAPGQRIGLQLEKLSTAPEGVTVRVQMKPAQGAGLMLSRAGTQAVLAIPPQAVPAGGEYVVQVDAGNGSLKSGELSLVVQEGQKP